MAVIKFKHNKKPVLIVFVLIILLAGIVIYVCNNIIDTAAKGKLYTDTKSIPFNRVGLLLGITKYFENGSANLYYNYRIAAAAKLLKDRKIKYLLVSGDSSESHYNEPYSMRTDLIKAGVDSSVIFLDCAGLRTFDSVVRLKAIFGEDSATIISQGFHNERALYIASRFNITAVGFNAADVTGFREFKMQCREKLARVKVFIDLMSGKGPKYLGDKVELPKN